MGCCRSGSEAAGYVFLCSVAKALVHCTVYVTINSSALSLIIHLAHKMSEIKTNFNLKQPQPKGM